jgi:hypothetical protein
VFSGREQEYELEAAYEVLSPLGAGGMAEVYCVRDTRLGRTVAAGGSRFTAPAISNGTTRLGWREPRSGGVGCVAGRHKAFPFGEGNTDRPSASALLLIARC